MHPDYTNVYPSAIFFGGGGRSGALGAPWSPLAPQATLHTLPKLESAAPGSTSDNLPATPNLFLVGRFISGVSIIEIKSDGFFSNHHTLNTYLPASHIFGSSYRLFA